MGGANGSNATPKPMIGVPGVCMRFLAESFIQYTRKEQQSKIDVFMKSVRIWVKGRDKHERLLRPRLGSPDAIEELNSLDAVELQRSQEMMGGVVRFRNSVLTKLMMLSIQYINDISVSSKGLLLYVDTSITQDIVQVPPDTAIPKVRLTLKRLRKAERLKSQIAQGQEDNTTMRVWPSINMDQMTAMAKEIEVIMKDNNTGDVQNIVTEEWVAGILKQTAVRAMVSTAHRALINERNRAVSVYLTATHNLAMDVSEKFSLLLKQEYSWNERWTRQVDMLKNGNI